MGSPGVGDFGDAQRGNLQILLTSGRDVTLVGPDTYSRFGSACAVYDVNADGHPDVVVGAPQTTGLDLVKVAGNYSGAVHVYYGSGGGVLSTQRNLTITNPGMFGQLGLNLQVLDGIGLAIAARTQLFFNDPQVGVTHTHTPIHTHTQTHPYTHTHIHPHTHALSFLSEHSHCCMTASALLC